MGVNGERLDAAEMAARRYSLTVNDIYIIVEIPVGAVGGNFKVSCTELLLEQFLNDEWDVMPATSAQHIHMHKQVRKCNIYKKNATSLYFKNWQGDFKLFSYNKIHKNMQKSYFLIEKMIQLFERKVNKSLGPQI